MMRSRRWLPLILSIGVFGAATFVALRGWPGLTLSIELEQDGSETRGTAFWADAGGHFRARASAGFEVPTGHSTHRIGIPDDVQTLRLDPTSAAGTVRIRRVAIERFRVPLRAWSARNGFAGWAPLNDVAGFGIRDGALVLQATGADPYLVVRGLGDLSQRLRMLHAALAVVIGTIVAAVHHRFLGPLSALGSDASPPVDSLSDAEPRPSHPFPKSIGTRSSPVRPRIVAFVLAGLLTVLGVLAVRSWHHRQTPPISAGGYELMLVDHRGWPLTEKAGDLRVMLDPFVLYRNYPGQETKSFTVEAHGLRGRFAPADTRPRAMVLGGSAAFGLGSASDDETLTARLAQKDPSRQWMNAAVIGYLSGQERAAMVERGEEFHPELYVVFDGWNEEYVSLFPDSEIFGGGFNSGVLAMIEGQLRVAVKSLSASAVPEGTSSPRGALSANRRQRWISNTYRRNLAGMATEAERQGAFLLAVFQPQLGSKRQRTAEEEKAWSRWQKASFPTSHADFVRQYDRLVEDANGFCQEHGIATLDLEHAPAFRESTERLFIDGVHLSPAGNELAARAIADALQVLGKIPPLPPSL